MTSSILAAVWSGFCFGTLLQVAVGPVCLFVFQTAASSGIFAGELAVLGVTVGDLLYIIAAVWGVGALIEKSSRAKIYFKYFGSTVLVLFGATLSLGAFGLDIMPGFDLTFMNQPKNAFLNALILTLSCPLTIVFWAGVFAAKITEGNMSRNDIYFFGAGALLSTVFFMSLTVAVGVFTGNLASPATLNVINGAVGVVLILLGIKTAVK